MAKQHKPKLSFVVHEHHASHLHYDFRLEMQDVLKSWVIPKGPSMNPSDKRLAIMVEDHLLKYGEFEGIIPEGHYGAGAVIIWDKGYYLPLENKTAEEQLSNGQIEFILHGEKLKGAFSLLQLKKGGKQWLLIKKQDKYADEKWKIKLALTPQKKRKLKVKIPPYIK